jgi:uncharacterized protein (DUF486 family)
MNQRGQLFRGFLALAAVLVVVGCLAWLLTIWFSHIKSSDKPATITALGLIVVAFITYFFNRGADRRRVLEEVTRREKIKVYEEVVQFFMRLIVPAPSLGPPTEAENLEFLAKTTPRLITYGSNAVVKLWGKYMRNIEKLMAQGAWDQMVAFEGVLKAMRKDIGHSAYSLQDGDLSRLFINDVDETIAARKAASRGSKEPDDAA